MIGLKPGPRSKAWQIIHVLSYHREGLLWRELLEPRTFLKFGSENTHVEYSFSRKTLDRYLKILIDKGFVEKAREPNKKGRPSGRYKIPEKYWNSLGCKLLTSRIPAKWIGSTPFPAKKMRAGLRNEFMIVLPKWQENYKRQKMMNYKLEEYRNWLLSSQNIKEEDIETLKDALKREDNKELLK
jgi:hypothetical protein